MPPSVLSALHTKYTICVRVYVCIRVLVECIIKANRQSLQMHYIHCINGVRWIILAVYSLILQRLKYTCNCKTTYYRRSSRLAPESTSLRPNETETANRFINETTREGISSGRTYFFSLSRIRVLTHIIIRTFRTWIFSFGRSARRLHATSARLTLTMVFFHNFFIAEQLCTNVNDWTCFVLLVYT